MKTNDQPLQRNRNFTHRVRELLSKPVRVAASVVLVASLSAGALIGCSQGSTSSSSASKATSNSSAPTSSQAGTVATQISNDIASMKFEYSNRDTDASYDESSATKIELSGSSATVTGNGASVSGSKVTISEEGTYILSGTASDVQIIVNASDSAKVQIVLAGVTMTSNSGPCINVETADKAFVTLAPSTSNTLSDGSWSLTGADDEPNATIYSACDLTINGSGSLTVNATVKHGIATKDDLKVTGGDITINAADDGLHGKDSVSVNNGIIAITAGGDGIKSTKDSDESKGFVTIDGGELNITAADDGIQATRLIQTTGGTTTINVKNDAFNSDLDVLINGGTVNVNAGDDAVHGEYYVDVVSGSFTANSSYEGLEGQVIEIAGGTINVTSSDDGINASPASTGSEEDKQAAETQANSQEQTMDRQRFEQFQNAGMQGNGMKQGMMDTSDACAILISGGVTTLVCEGDSVDSNGSLTMSGGELYISGTTQSGNGALDSGTGATITGGTVIASSAGGMEESFGSSSTQASVVANVSGSAGDVVSIVDSSGKTVVSYTTQHAYSWILASSAGITNGSSYEIQVNGNSAATATATTEQQAQGFGGPMGGGMPSQEMQAPQGSQQSPQGGRG